MENKIDCEKELAHLEEIVEKMETSSLPLEESLSLFEEGQKSLKKLKAALDEAKAKIEKYSK